MRVVVKQTLQNEDEMSLLATQLAPCLVSGCYLYLSGQLGAGKTTFARYLLRGLGYQGKVKSPTYTLVEPYQIGDLEVFHFDLYRLRSEEELRFIGIEEYFTANSICLVEWPEKARDVLPTPDIFLHLYLNQDLRQVILASESTRGEQMLRDLQAILQ